MSTRAQTSVAVRNGLCLLLSLALASACAGPGSNAPPSEKMLELAAARSASRASQWSDAAARWYDIYLLGDEREREACAQASRALIETGDPKSAQHLAELGSRKFPKDTTLLSIQAEALVAQGLPHAADTVYEHALRLEPSERKLVFALAKLRCDLKQFDSALALLKPRIDSGGANSAEFTLAARAERALQQYPEAFLSCERAFDLEVPSAERLVQAASMYAEPSVREQNPRAAATAREWLKRALALDPQSTLGHFYLGMIAEDEKKDGEAALCYRRAVETDPACVIALTSLAKLQQRRGEIENSKAMAERALALEKDPVKRAVLEELVHPKTPEPAPADGVNPPPKSDG